MQQLVTVSQFFENLSHKIKIIAVYQKDNTLLAVIQVQSTGNIGEACYTSKDSLMVTTNASEPLPVKILGIKDGKTLESIVEIQGLQPLSAVASAAAHGIFAHEPPPLPPIAHLFANHPPQAGL